MNCSQDVLFYGPLDKCPVCGDTLEISNTTYLCRGVYSEWSSCTFTARDPPRRDEPIKLPESVVDSGVAEVICCLFFLFHFNFDFADGLLENHFLVV